MEQTGGLFCTCDSGVARCQAQHQWPTSNRTIVPTIVTIVLIRTAIVGTIVTPRTYSRSTVGQSIVTLVACQTFLATWVQELSVDSKGFVLQNKSSLCSICGPHLFAIVNYSRLCIYTFFSSAMKK